MGRKPIRDEARDAIGGVPMREPTQKLNVERFLLNVILFYTFFRSRILGRGYLIERVSGVDISQGRNLQPRRGLSRKN